MFVCLVGRVLFTNFVVVFACCALNIVALFAFAVVHLKERRGAKSVATPK